MRDGRGRPSRGLRLRLLRLEEAQEGRMLGEERLDLENSCARPVLEPGFAEVVFDLVKAAFTHGSKYRHERRTAPWAERLIRGVVRPTDVPVPARPQSTPSRTLLPTALEFRLEPHATRARSAGG